MSIFPYTVTRRLLISLVVVAVLLAVLYAATPLMVSQLGPVIAKRFGLKTLEIDIGYPRWRSVEIRQLVFATDQVRIRGSNARADFRIREVLHGRLESLNFGELEASVHSVDEPESNEGGAPVDLKLLAPPVGHLGIEKLTVRFADTGFVGEGFAELGNGVLSFSIDGIEPEAASRFALTANLTRDGSFNARFAERGDALTEYLRIEGMVGESSVGLDGKLQLKGFALQLASEVLGLPPGSGSINAELSMTLPWPLPASGQWPELSGTVPTFAVDWRSVDKRMELKRVTGALEYAGRDVTGSASGAVEYRWPERVATLSMPKQYRFKLADNVLSGGKGLRVRMKDADSDIHAKVNSFSLATRDEASLDIGFDLSAKLSALDLEGATKLHVELPAAQRLRATGNFEFDGDAKIADQKHAGSVAGKFSLNSPDLEVAGTISSGIFRKVPFELIYEIESGAGKLSAENSIVIDKPLAKTLFADWREKYDLDAGQVNVSLKLDWQTLEKINTVFALALSDGRAHHDENRASGISAILQLRSTDAADFETWKLEPTRVSAAQVNVGVPIEDVTFDLDWSGDSLSVNNLQGSVLGGRAFADAITYGIDAGDADFLLRLEDIELSAMLALEGDDITGSGKIDGTLPVSLRNNQPSVQGGSLQAQAPGGTVSLHPSFSGPAGQPGLVFALVALKDFTYSELRAEVNYAENGDLALAVHLLGRNTEVENGRPIQYNLTINENIPVLLESLQLKDKLGEKIEKGINN